MIKKGVDARTAQKYQAVFLKAGAVLEAENLHPEEETPDEKVSSTPLMEAAALVGASPEKDDPMIFPRSSSL